MAKKYDYKYRHRETYCGVQIDIKAKTSADLIRKVKAKKDKIDRASISPDTKLSVFGDMFLRTYKMKSVSWSWYNDMEAIMKSKIVGGIGNRPVGRIRPMDVQLMLNECSDLSDSYIKKIFDLTKQLFHQAYKNGLTPTDFSEDLVRPAGKANGEGRSLTPRESASLLRVISGTVDELFLRIILQCGLRPGEVIALQWKDIDFREKNLTVERAMKKDGSVGPPKSAAGLRTVPVPSDLLDLMREQRGGPFSLVCPKQKGGMHTKSSLRKMWDRTKYAMNVEMGADLDEHGNITGIHPVQEPLRMYDLRHTYCTNLEKAGVPINIAARLMGHADISVTSKIYTHASTEALDIARSLIDPDGKSDSDGKSEGKKKRRA